MKPVYMTADQFIDRLQELTRQLAAPWGIKDGRMRVFMDCPLSNVHCPLTFVSVFHDESSRSRIVLTDKPQCMAWHAADGRNLKDPEIRILRSKLLTATGLQ